MPPKHVNKQRVRHMIAGAKRDNWIGRKHLKFSEGSHNPDRIPEWVEERTGNQALIEAKEKQFDLQQKTFNNPKYSSQENFDRELKSKRMWKTILDMQKENTFSSWLKLKQSKDKTFFEGFKPIYSELQNLWGEINPADYPITGVFDQYKKKGGTVKKKKGGTVKKKTPVGYTKRWSTQRKKQKI